ncbi:hypothetical protein BU16DRAFT_612930 [Lophium mytilinum]|uniref:F-box domain-containing protein n=1 Tax=Lophium mytilinum TaxID=390894 RepID=A0A6A6RBU3_9PEZI|nr:hypothetical protein BU16DRAFT_612930 [Lophium mytilinum]
MELQTWFLQDAHSNDARSGYSSPPRFLEYPAEIVDIIAQALPRNSFLALRRTCRHVRQITDWHFKNRHLLEKRVALVDGACLNSLVELANYPEFANRVRNVRIEIGDSLVLIASGFESWNTHEKSEITDWTRHFNASEIEPDKPWMINGSWVNKGRAVNLGLLSAALEQLPALESIEIIERPMHTLTRSRRKSKPFLDAQWCYRCAGSPRSNNCYHFFMFSKALRALAVNKEHHLNNCNQFIMSLCPSPGVHSSVAPWAWINTRYEYLNPLAENHIPRPIFSLASLKRLTYRGDGFAQYTHQGGVLRYNLLKYLSCGTEHLETIVSHSTITTATLKNQYEARRWHILPQQVDILGNSLASLTLKALYISPGYLPYVITQHQETLRYIALDGLPLMVDYDALATTPDTQPGTAPIMNSLRQCTKLQYVSVRAPIQFNCPILFGDPVSCTEALVCMSMENKREPGRRVWDYDKMFEWCRIGRDEPERERINSDLAGWKFEGSDTQPGVENLAEKGRLFLQVPENKDMGAPRTSQFQM